ncbi:GNAT family N-acetyltransferase [Candidatus Woesearchaeota archaeon]|nr:GNAT family N-acetyltransferase [Candidatus Woesearchaeota archaeon]
MIKYSIVTENDLDSVARLFLEVYSGLLKKVFRKLPNRDFIKDVMQLYLDAAQQGFIIAKDKGKVVGFACGVKNVRDLWKQALKPGRFLKFFFTPRQIFIMPPSFSHIFHAHVPLMGVSKKYRMEGIGLKLSDKIISFFEKNKIKTIYFQIPNNLVDTYVRHGCEILKRKKGWTVMRKKV